jgi:hypothetical protein
MSCSGRRDCPGCGIFLFCNSSATVALAERGLQEFIPELLRPHFGSVKLRVREDRFSSSAATLAANPALALSNLNVKRRFFPRL